MTSKEATLYCVAGIKEGYYAPEQFEGWTDEQLIEFAEKEGDRGDHYANSQE